MQSSALVASDSARNQEFSRRAIEHIHTTAISCQSGALEQAAESLGILAF